MCGKSLVQVDTDAVRSIGRRFLRCERGAALAEFALITPVFLSFLIGVFELGMVGAASTLLEGGIREASRFGVTGGTSGNETRIESIRRIIGEHTAGLVDMEEAQIDTLVYDSFITVGTGEEVLEEDPCTQVEVDDVCFIDTNNNGVWDEDFGTEGVGGPGEIVLYRVTYDWSTITGFLDYVLGDDGVFTLSAAVAVRNEPFPEPVGN